MFLWNFSVGQNYDLANIYTVKDGLPSNFIYEIAEDNNGFLWISTDNGISRFDGKRFVNYTTKDGLPSNDVIQIIKDIDGTIWVNCYKQPPSYFDDKLNRFISFEENTQILELSKNLLIPIINPNGGIIFHNNHKSLHFRNKIFIGIQDQNKSLFFINGKIYYRHDFTNNKKIRTLSYYDVNHKLLKKIVDKNPKPTFYSFFENNTIFDLHLNQVEVLNLSDKDFLKIDKKIINFSNRIKWYKIHNNEIAILLINGDALIYDKKTLKLKHQINTQKNLNSYYKDKNNTIWISTVNNGLLKYSNSNIKTYCDFQNEDTNFLSIHVDNKNKVFLGNFNSSIFECDKNLHKSHKINDEKLSWIRGIYSFDNRKISITDNGYSIDFNKTIDLKTKYNFYATSLKTGEKLNDSTLIIGTNGGLLKMNVLNNKYKLLSFSKERILNVKKNDDNSFYFTANNGLYKYDLKLNNYQPYFLNKLLKNDNIIRIEIAKNNNVWLATSKGNIYLINKNKILFKIENSVKIPINITNLVLVGNDLWIASKSGIYILSTLNLKNYNLKRLTTADGLKSNIVNDLFFKDKMIYAATSNGYSIISSKNIQTNFEVLPRIISIKSNEKSLKIEKNIPLKATENFISLNLAGVDLTGHFHQFKYKINTSKWIYFDDNILNLKLQPGKSSIIIKAIDVNGNESSKNLLLNFDVAIPFYNTLWFWTLISFALAGFLFWIFNRQKFANQKRKFEQQLELEQQRSKITADLHDEIGSTLSSLQINSTVANKLIDKDVVSARKILVKLEEQSKSLADKIGDIIWSMKPGKDEFMTLSTRIKNFTSDILENTDIDYKIEIETQIDNKVTNIDMRKNIVFFIKEAINNAVKYSKATTLNIFVKEKNNQIYIEIIDNGIGFDTSQTKGNGIGNMKKRIEELNGQFNINSKINKGTIINATISIVP